MCNEESSQSADDCPSFLASNAILPDSERWMSGLSRTPGKRVWVYPHRGFESRLLRQIELPRALRGFYCCKPDFF